MGNYSLSWSYPSTTKNWGANMIIVQCSCFDLKTREPRGRVFFESTLSCPAIWSLNFPKKTTTKQKILNEKGAKKGLQRLLWKALLYQLRKECDLPIHYGQYVVILKKIFLKESRSSWYVLLKNQIFQTLKNTTKIWTRHHWSSYDKEYSFNRVY